MKSERCPDFGCKPLMLGAKCKRTKPIAMIFCIADPDRAPTQTGMSTVGQNEVDGEQSAPPLPFFIQPNKVAWRVFAHIK